MTRVVGPPRSRRRRWLGLISLVVTAGMAVIFVPSALAVHDFVFQLDGDVSAHAYSTPNAGQVYDWGGNCLGNEGTLTQACQANGLFHVSDAGGIETVSNNSALIGAGKLFDTASFARDFQSGSPCALNSTSTTFCTGDSSTYATGSKDTLGIGNGGWQCNKDNNVNSKIDIMNAYSASYFTDGNGSTGDHIIYFGLEKN